MTDTIVDIKEEDRLGCVCLRHVDTRGVVTAYRRPDDEESRCYVIHGQCYPTNLNSSAIGMPVVRWVPFVEVR